MITFIICSIRPEVCNRLLQNLSETAGVEYETIVFDNRDAQWGLCRVYNHCAEKARFPYLCFLHEDIRIETKAWGKKMIETVEKIPDCGVAGFAGGLQMGKNATSWWAGPTRMNIYSGSKGKNHLDLKLNYTHHLYSNPDTEEVSQVLCVDGVFHFVRKTIWELIRYDEDSFSGFHFYDVDFSFAVAEKYSNYALLNFDVFHDSDGSINADYLKNMFVFQRKWNRKLPKNIKGEYPVSAELSEAFTMFILCLKKHVSIKKCGVQIYRINKLPLFILILFYIPVQVVIKIFYRIMRQRKSASAFSPQLLRASKIEN